MKCGVRKFRSINFTTLEELNIKIHIQLFQSCEIQSSISPSPRISYGVIDVQSPSGLAFFQIGNCWVFTRLISKPLIIKKSEVRPKIEIFCQKSDYTSSSNLTSDSPDFLSGTSDFYGSSFAALGISQKIIYAD